MKRTLPTTVLALALLAGASATAAPASAVGSTFPQCFLAKDCPRQYPVPRTAPATVAPASAQRAGAARAHDLHLAHLHRLHVVHLRHAG